MTTTSITIQASARTAGGKGPAGRVRAGGKVPAIVYGPGEKGRAIAVEAKDIRAILHSPLGGNTVVTLTVDGHTQLALLKSFDHDPMTRGVVHADFYSVSLDRPITVQVPFVLTGKSKGIANEGGILRQIFRSLPVVTTPDKIPAKIEGDITNLGLGESLHVRELVLPAGVAIKLDGSQTVVSIVAPEKDTEVAKVPGAPEAKAAAPAGKDAKAPAAKDAKAAPAKKK
jgi:large subunit ribosomal protein L25